MPSTQLPETWFDTTDGALLIGELAVEERFAQTGLAAIRLSELLTSDSFPFSEGDFVLNDSNDWSEEDLVHFGKWALLLIQPSEENQPSVTLKVSHMHRLHMLGLGPQRRKYYKTFGNFTAYQEKIGSSLHFFNHWTTERYVELAADIYKVRQSKPTVEDFMEMSRMNDTPSWSVLHHKLGGISLINELIGFPSWKDWQEEDLIEWGVEAYRANSHRSFTPKLIHHLSKVGLGPSRSLVIRTFGSWSEFKNRVKNDLVKPIHLPSYDEFTKQLYDRFGVDQATLPNGFEDLTYTVQNDFFSHYLLTKAVLGDMEEASKIARRQIMSGDRLEYIILLRKIATHTSLAQIKRLSSEFGTYFPRPSWDINRESLRVD